MLTTLAIVSAASSGLLNCWLFRMVLKLQAQNQELERYFR